MKLELMRGRFPGDFTQEENLLIKATFVMTIRRIENIYVQVREGLVQEEAVLRFRPSKDYFETPYFREFWKIWRLELEPEFRVVFEREFLN